MKYLIGCVVLFLISIHSMAQEKKDFMRYEYSLTFKPYDVKVMPDSLPITEKFYLDIDGSNSMFYDEFTYQEFVAELEEIEIDIQNSQVPWMVSKDSGSIILYEMINSLEAYKVKQPLNLIQWTISSEIEEYHGMKVQKATGELSGRNWTVWFTTEIPIIEGPYKFKNLPGFVVKAEDKNKDYVFEFTESMRVHNYWIELKELDFFKEVTGKQLNRLKTLNANKTYMQLMQERGGKLMNDDKEPSDFMTKKFGKEPNPIELY